MVEVVAPVRLRSISCAPGQPQVDILSGPNAFQPKFKYEPTFQEHRVPQNGDDARQESVEHQ